jgi:hypothetical protein
MPSGRVLNWEMADKWFNDRRYKNRNHRTIYRNNLKVAPLTGEARESFPMGTGPRLITDVEMILPEFKDVFVGTAGKTQSQVFYDIYHDLRSLGKGISTLTEEIVGDVFNEGENTTKHLLENSDILEEFYPIGSYTLSWGYGGGYLVYRPDGGYTITSGNWSMSQGLSNLFSTYIGRYERVEGTPYVQGTKGLYVPRHQNRNLIVTRHTGTTNLKSGRCSYCRNRGQLPEWCNYALNCRISDGGYYDTKMNLRCRHGRRESHDDWTNLMVCPSCSGDKEHRGRRVYAGLEWSGAPIMLDKDVQIIKSLVSRDATEIFPWRTRSVNPYMNEQLGVETHVQPR